MASLTQEQINWLDKCTTLCGINGSWTLNPKTGLVDVKKDFDCSKQGLTDFNRVRFGEVSGNFNCRNNSLTSLEGAPQKVGGGGFFDCTNNRLTSLVGAPQEVGGFFNCAGNLLTSLVGAPQKIGHNFICWSNRLVSLEGAPQRVSGRKVRLNDIHCSANPVSEKTLLAVFEKMCEGHSFVIAAASLKNEMSKTSWKLIARHIPEAIQPGVSMLARFGVFV